MNEVGRATETAISKQGGCVLDLRPSAAALPEHPGWQGTSPLVQPVLAHGWFADRKQLLLPTPWGAGLAFHQNTTATCYLWKQTSQKAPELLQ